MDLFFNIMCSDSLCACTSFSESTVTAEAAAAANDVTSEEIAWTKGLLKGAKVFCLFDATPQQQNWIREESDAQFVMRGGASDLPVAVYISSDRTLTVTPPAGASAVWVEERRGDGRQRSTKLLGVSRAVDGVHDAVFAMPRRPRAPTHIAIYASLRPAFFFFLGPAPTHSRAQGLPGGHLARGPPPLRDDGAPGGEVRTTKYIKESGR